MDYDLNGKTALVTGSTRGIGFACASALAREGMRLVLFSRTEASLDAAAAQIRRDTGAHVDYVAGDMSSGSDVDRLRSRLLELGGAPDVLVLNTGRPPLNLREVLEENDEGRWEQAFQTQLKGGVQVLSKIVPLMVAKRYGRVVAITSATVKQPMPHHSLSTVFRAGLAGYLKHLANEVAPHNVTVNSVMPASIGTEGFLKSFEPSQRIKVIPLGRLGTPEECAALVAFLASKQAGFITGTSIPVDGGMISSLT